MSNFNWPNKIKTELQYNIWYLMDTFLPTYIDMNSFPFWSEYRITKRCDETWNQIPIFGNILESLGNNAKDNRVFDFKMAKNFKQWKKYITQDIDHSQTELFFRNALTFTI